MRGKVKVRVRQQRLLGRPGQWAAVVVCQRGQWSTRPLHTPLTQHWTALHPTSQHIRSTRSTLFTRSTQSTQPTPATPATP